MFVIKTFINLFVTIQLFIQVTYCFGNSGLLSDLVEINFNSLNISAFCKDDLNLLSNGFKNHDIWATKCKIYYITYNFNLNITCVDKISKLII